MAKAWEEVDRVGWRAHWDPKTVLVTGAGPIGLLAALIGGESATSPSSGRSAPTAGTTRRQPKRSPRPTVVARRLITRSVPLDQWQEAIQRQPDDVKVVIGVNKA